LTREGIAAAAVADVLDVTLLPAAAGGGGDAVELLLRVVDNPHIVAEHDPGHPVQVGWKPANANRCCCTSCWHPVVPPWQAGHYMIDRSSSKVVMI
jgi:hypothetical protein